ncbi:putative toxin-antitoxin system toxin component, PIN family [Inquilinus sp. KBS0705]|nr:putative toxin-antitoxin system toxin component, PIN family [Inquilinus sp. KBS0705]
MKTNRFVFDTNTLISAVLISNSTGRRALNTAVKVGALVFCEDTINELGSVLVRSKFDKYVSLDSRIDFLKGIKERAQMVGIISMFTDCRDANDNVFLNLAFDAKADCIISGDADLLVLNPFKDIPILSASEFLLHYS